MWIAKPLHALSEVEKRQWIHLCSWRRRVGETVPLSQTLTWGRAAATACQVYGVFDSRENVGGLVLGVPVEGGMAFECVNGPLLDWDSPEKAPRQVATFAKAVSQLSSQFLQLKLRPRWVVDPTERLARRLAGLPLEMARSEKVSTLVLSLSESEASPERFFSSRLKRTLKASEQVKQGVFWESLTGAVLDEFLDQGVANFQEFGQRRGFFTPGKSWFSKFLEPTWVSEAEQLRFFQVQASVGGESQVQCRLLVALQGTQASYLWGAESRPAGVRGSWSAQALAQREALVRTQALGAQVYDFNGYLAPEEESSAYAGVARFKAQFGGQVIRYQVPEFFIS